MMGGKQSKMSDSESQRLAALKKGTKPLDSYS